MRLVKVNWFVIFIGMFSSPSSVAVSELWLNRYAYDAIQQGFNNKDISVYHRKRASIDDYPLAAYTDYRAFLFDINNKTPQQVNQFSQDFFDYPFSVSIRVDYLNAMIATRNWANLLAYQKELPKDQNYQCYYYTAFYHQGKKDIAFDGAKSLWLNGKSVSSACDELFQHWANAGLRTDDVIKQRALLSIEKRNPKLIKYLAKLVSTKTDRLILNEMYMLYQNPIRVTEAFTNKDDTLFNRDYAQVLLKHLARNHIDKAYLAFTHITDHYSYKGDEIQNTSEFIAVRLLQSTDDKEITWRDDVFKRSDNDYVLEQRVRLAISKTKWQEAYFWIARLSDEAQATYRWQYWLARSEIALKETEKGEARLKRIMGYRHFYSFAAAITLNRAIKYPIANVDFQFDDLTHYHPDLQRVNELLRLGKEAPAKSQWRYLIARDSHDDRAKLAAYAKQEGWHDFSFESTLRGELWDYIDLRFPVRYYSLFKHYGKKHNIDPITLLALARQESGFNSLSQSPVGALGVMQVLPSTAKYMADKYKSKYKQPTDLFDAEKNIAIGSQYLSSLLRRYKQNRALAFSAYNAGPTMVGVWRKQASDEMDIFVYIESITFKETRVYVKNILMFEEYYRYVLGVKGDFLNDSEWGFKKSN